MQYRSANELPAETQNLRGHNSAPHATRTLRPRLNRSLQPGKHMCMKIPVFYAGLLISWVLAPIVVRFLLLFPSRSTSATYHNPSSRSDTHYDQRPLEPLSNLSQLLAYRVPTCQRLESSSGRTPHVVRDRSASELRAEKQSLGDHNPAPQANQTLRLIKLAGPYKLENTNW